MTTTTKTIKSVEVNDSMGFMSYPPQNYVTIKYSDGTSNTFLQRDAHYYVYGLLREMFADKTNVIIEFDVANVDANGLYTVTYWNPHIDHHIESIHMDARTLRHFIRSYGTITNDTALLTAFLDEAEAPTITEQTDL